MSGIEFLHPKNEWNVPISKAAVAGDYFFTWGYGENLDPSDPKPGMRKVFEHLRALLQEKGLTFADVVKVTGLLSSLELFTPYNEVYREYLKEPFPVRTSFCIITEKPLLEVDVIAYRKGLSG